MQVECVRAVLFAKNLEKLVRFYTEALGLTKGASDDSHAVLTCRDFELIIHQIPQPAADHVRIEQPPVRRSGSAMRLDYRVVDLEGSRERSKQLGGIIDEQPPEWAQGDANFVLGHDPEGNPFGVSEHG
ncbi:MAG: VOC family protein [Gammaproteobacteria bacterium]